MKLETAQQIISAALTKARDLKIMPVAIVVLDARGALKAMVAEDGTSLKRAEIAIGKAFGAVSLGIGSRALFNRVQEQPYFLAAATHAVGGKMIPLPGGVLIKDEEGTLLGAIGISGDSSENDEIAAVAGIEAVGLVAETG